MTDLVDRLALAFGREPAPDTGGTAAFFLMALAFGLAVSGWGLAAWASRLGRSGRSHTRTPEKR